MKKNFKRYLLTILALVLVLVTGKFTSDYFLKATDGEENVVNEAEAEEAAIETVEADDVTEIVSNVEGTFETAETDVLESGVVAPAGEAQPAEVITAESPEETAEITEIEDLDALEETEEELEEIPEEEVSALQEERSIKISYEFLDETTVLLTSDIEGYEGADVTYQWQYDAGNGWKDIAGATDSEYRVEITEDNESYFYRLRVDAIVDKNNA